MITMMIIIVITKINRRYYENDIKLETEKCSMPCVSET